MPYQASKGRSGGKGVLAPAARLPPKARSAGKPTPSRARARRPKAAKGSEREAVAEARPAGGPESFPVVGIGASAGGLEALEQHLRHVPANSGMAYVVIQHLDPTHKGAMVELLQRATTMPVVRSRTGRLSGPTPST